MLSLKTVFSVLIATLIFSLSLAGVAAAQGNTSLGTGALQKNTTGSLCGHFSSSISPGRQVLSNHGSSGP